VDSKSRTGHISGWPWKWGAPDHLNACVTYTGTLLRDTGDIGTGTYGGFEGMNGYVDSAGDASWVWPSWEWPGYDVARDAIKADGTPANLNPARVRFVKVQTAVFRYGGVFGDMSTEIVSATNLPDQSGGFPMP
jgi:hypothetical protein